MRSNNKFAFLTATLICFNCLTSSPRLFAQYAFNDAYMCNPIISGASKGNNGFHLNGYFNDCPPGFPCRGLIQMLAPDVLRFPAGGGSKFMHFMNEGVLINTNAGYGRAFTLPSAEIENVLADFYNVTASDIVTNCTTAVSPCGCTTTTGLTGGLKKATDAYCDLYVDYCNQDLGNNNNYLVQFADLVDDIESATGNTMSVIYVANILSATDQELIDILDYLINFRGINVVGVEMGSETYAWKEIFTGTNRFDNYYDWIQGVDLPTYSYNSGFHDYIGSIRRSASPAIRNLKIGLVAAPAPITYTNFYGNPIPLYSAATASGYSEWNSNVSGLGAVWNATQTYTPDGGIPYTGNVFDAFVIHPYYESKFWVNAALYPAPSFSEAAFTTPSNIPIIYAALDGDGNLWQAFDRASDEFSYYAKTGFRQQVIDGYYVPIFNLLNASNQKKLWFTEWNLLNGQNDGSPGSAAQSIFYNTFAQSIFVSLFKHTIYDINVNPAYKPKLVEYAVFDKLSGESPSFITSRFNDDGDVICPATFENPYYKIDGDDNGTAGTQCDDNDIVKRLSFYTHLMMKDFNQSLDKVEYAAVAPYNTDPTLSVRLYTDPGRTNAYIYFSNWAGSPLEFATLSFKPSELVFWNKSLKFKYEADPAKPSTIQFVDASKLYSTAGYSQLHEYRNLYYGLADGIYSEHITHVPLISLPYGSTWSAPANSQGVIIVPLKYTYLPGIPDCPITRQSEQFSEPEENSMKVTLYPNPSNGMINVLFNKFTTEEYLLSIYSSEGKLLIEKFVKYEDNMILDHLPSGIYFYSITQNSRAFNQDKLVIIE